MHASVPKCNKVKIDYIADKHADDALKVKKCYRDEADILKRELEVMELDFLLDHKGTTRAGKDGDGRHTSLARALSGSDHNQLFHHVKRFNDCMKKMNIMIEVEEFDISDEYHACMKQSIDDIVPIVRRLNELPDMARAEVQMKGEDDQIISFALSIILFGGIILILAMFIYERIGSLSSPTTTTSSSTAAITGSATYSSNAAIRRYSKSKSSISTTNDARVPSMIHSYR